MKTHFLLKEALVGFFLILNLAGYSQKTGTDPLKIQCQIPGYSVELDKNIQKDMKNSGEFKVVYTCIPAGVLIVESKLSGAKAQMDKIEIMFAKHTDTKNLTLREVQSTSEAETQCSSKRTTGNTN